MANGKKIINIFNNKCLINDAAGIIINKYEFDNLCINAICEESGGILAGFKQVTGNETRIVRFSSSGKKKADFILDYRPDSLSFYSGKICARNSNELKIYSNTGKQRKSIACPDGLINIKIYGNHIFYNTLGRIYEGNN